MFDAIPHAMDNVDEYEWMEGEIVAGLALADQMQGRTRVTACFFGKGAVAEGEFHECMNLAALWHLPVLFCCENNLYAMGTALERSEAETNLALRASAYGMASWSVDGMDVVRKIEQVPTGNKGMHQNVPTEPVMIKSITVVK